MSFYVTILVSLFKKHVVGCDAKAFNICSSILDTLCLFWTKQKLGLDSTFGI